MKTQKSVLVLMAIVLMAGLVVSCEEKPPPGPPPPPPPTPEEIKQAARDVWKSILNPKDGESLKDFGQRSSSALQSYKAKYGDTETGIQEIQSFITRISTILRTFMDTGNWEIANLACANLLALNPNSSQAKMSMKKIRRELAKPKVALTGFMKIGDKLYVMFEVIEPQPEEGPEIPKELRTKSEKVEVGEEFHGYRLKRVISGQQATIVYLDTNTTTTLQVRRSE